MKGILFKPEMIKAIVDGRKTQTRRVMPNQPYGMDKVYEKDFRKDYGLRKPRYQVGDTVYIKEGWDSDCTCGNPKCNGVIYKLGYSGVIVPTKWRSPLFMPAWAARYFIKITDVRVERLQEITLEDIRAEGIGQEWLDTKGFFISMWNSINPKYHWESNPWVWVYSFEKVEGIK